MKTARIPALLLAGLLVPAALCAASDWEVVCNEYVHGVMDPGAPTWVSDQDAGGAAVACRYHGHANPADQLHVPPDDLRTFRSELKAIADHLQGRGLAAPVLAKAADGRRALATVIPNGELCRSGLQCDSGIWGRYSYNAARGIPEGFFVSSELAPHLRDRTLLPGPDLLATGVAAHELFHAFQTAYAPFQQDLGGKETWISEGTAEAVASYWLRRRGIVEGDYWFEPQGPGGRFSKSLYLPSGDPQDDLDTHPFWDFLLREKKGNDPSFFKEIFAQQGIEDSEWSQTGVDAGLDALKLDGLDGAFVEFLSFVGEMKYPYPHLLFDVCTPLQIRGQLQPVPGMGPILHARPVQSAPLTLPPMSARCLEVTAHIPGGADGGIVFIVESATGGKPTPDMHVVVDGQYLQLTGLVASAPAALQFSMYSVPEAGNLVWQQPIAGGTHEFYVLIANTNLEGQDRTMRLEVAVSSFIGP